MGWWHEMWYGIQRTILKICDTIHKVFNQLIGLSDVTIDGKDENIVTYFLQDSKIWNAFLIIVIVGFSLLVLFMILSIIRAEMKEENVANKKKIYKNGAKSVLSFLLVPVVLFVGIFLVNGIMQSINGATAGSSMPTTIGGEITVIAGEEAFTKDEAQREEIEGKIKAGAEGYDYGDVSLMGKYYDFSKMDKVLGIVGGIAIMVVLAISILRLIQRIIEIVLLFIISPVAVSTMPLDDGARFNTWREMLISKVLGAYGIIITMNIFFMVLPVLMRIDFGISSIGAGILKILFILGGALAINLGNLIIAQLISPNAGNQEAQQQAANFRTGLLMGRTAGGVAIAGAGRALGGQNWAINRRFGGGVISSFFGGGRNMFSGASTTSGMFRNTTTSTYMPPFKVRDAVKGFTVDAAKNFANGGIFGVLGGAGRGMSRIAHRNDGKVTLGQLRREENPMIKLHDFNNDK